MAAGHATTPPNQATPAWRSSRRTQAISTALALALSVAFYLVFVARTGFRVGGELFFTLFDDAMVSMRYAQNLAAGQGLVWNPGADAVEGYSNLLWTLWMAVVHLLGAPESKTSLLVMLSGVAILVAGLLVVRALVRRVVPGSAFAMFVALLLTGLYYPLVYWTLRGMEVGLVTLVVSALCLQALRVRERPTTGRLWALAGLMAVGALTRDDVLLPCLLVTGYVLLTTERRDRLRAALVLVGTVAVAVGLHEAFRIHYYGDPLPNTYYLKIEGIGLGTRLRRGILTLTDAAVVGLYAPLALAVVGLATRRRELPTGTWLLVAVFLAQCAYSVYVGGDAWDASKGAGNRYVTSAVPSLLVLSALGAEALVSGRARRWWLALVALFLLAGGVALWWPPALPRVLAHLPYEEEDAARRAVLALVAAALVAVGALLAAGAVLGGRRPGAMRSSLVAALVTAAAFLPLTGLQYLNWIDDNAFDFREYAAHARYGLALRGVTKPGTSVAVTSAGTVPYFSRRPAVDLLGKSDPVVAHSRPQGKFTPGHNKFVYAHSIGRLRPDLVAEIDPAFAPYFAAIRQDGYEPILGTGLLAEDYLEIACEGYVRSELVATETGRLSGAPRSPRAGRLLAGCER